MERMESKGNAKMTTEHVNISIDDAYLDRFAEVLERLERTGLKVDQQLGTIGVVTGSIEPAKRVDLLQVEGVSAVEPSQQFQLPPPERDIQ